MSEAFNYMGCVPYIIGGAVVVIGVAIGAVICKGKQRSEELERYHHLFDNIPPEELSKIPRDRLPPVPHPDVKHRTEGLNTDLSDIANSP